MILELNHKKLTLYAIARDLVKQCYLLTANLPKLERFGIVQQINRAATSVLLNIAEGASRKSKTERRRFYEIARGSIIEIDAALHICVDVGYIQEISIDNLRAPLKSCFSILSKMISLSQAP